MARLVPLNEPNKAVIAARARREKAQAVSEANIEWYIKEVSDKIAMTLEQRMGIAVEYLRTKVVKNISKPVEVQIYQSRHIHEDEHGNKIEKWVSRRVVTQRSVPGEFPRADTTFLMKTIFGHVQVKKGSVSGYVGSPMEYALPLELDLDRSFLVRTLHEERSRIVRLLTGPIV